MIGRVHPADNLYYIYGLSIEVHHYEMLVRNYEMPERVFINRLTQLCNILI